MAPALLRGRTHQPLLDAGLAAGLPLPYSCTVGTCGTCACVLRLRDGEVTHPEPTRLTPSPGQKAEGRVLACVSRPLTGVTLDLADPTASDRRREC
ncbi:2Fe-2S iron-sulfur cluster-binding protein [Streptomyces griseus]|uniref:2Fe-2S iron-sulfur cluster-binding protein n=1 Tax=Streptomyces griseus TaxID=1911 RepID=UPI0033C4D18F